MDNFNITNINADNFEFQTYSPEDGLLISGSNISSSFNPERDYVEYHIINLNDVLLESDFSFADYIIENNEIILNPDKDLINRGYNEGQYNVLYHFFEKLFKTNPTKKFFISEISSDRTELKITALFDDKLVGEYRKLKDEINNSEYYKDFYLNFGKNELIISINILDDENDDRSFYIKLYEPLPNTINEKSELWIVDKVANSIAYNINILKSFENVQNLNYLKGPNFNINLNNKINNSIEYFNYDGLLSSSNVNLQNQLNNQLAKKGISINVDYTDYNQFIYFSSALVRLENFYYKMGLIETYNASSSYSTNSSINSNFYVSSSYNVWQNKIDELINNFDGYENYLYFSSGSKAWPKNNSTQPYINSSYTSSAATTWLTPEYSSGSDFDRENIYSLRYAIPSYLRNDTNNAPYELFVDMMGQHYDNIWIYIKDISNKFDADNRTDYGISKDIVANALREFGIKIYQNNFSNEDLYNAFLGIGSDGSTLPPTGSEIISNYVTASSEIVPLDNLNKEIYNRLYHNLPYLLKKKGTLEGLRTLVNCYGIPSTILKFSEFGGKDRDNFNDWDYWQNKFNYAFRSSGSGGWVDIPWETGSLSGSFPNTVEFRFKPLTLTQTIAGGAYSQSLVNSFNSNDFSIMLEYGGSGSLSGSYSGSISDPDSKYATLKYYNTQNSSSASITMPFFNGDWWSVMVAQVSNDATHSLYVANNGYIGDDGDTTMFQASASCWGANTWNDIGTLKFPPSQSLSIGGKTYQPFSGSFQEVRYYSILLNTSSFYSYALNPLSIEGNSLNGYDSSQNALWFRAPLGAVLDNGLITTRTSVHPAITGSYTTTSSFSSNSTYTLNGVYEWVANEEYIFSNQPITGISNRITDKIKISPSITASGDTLSPYISIEQNLPYSSSYVKNLNILEAGFSPSNEINDDITNQLGAFNIGDLLGNPSVFNATGSTRYVELDKFANKFFEKYTHNYDTKDYLRLIKYFDNSLFKLIEDFTPARTSLSTGIIIKPHILERNRHPITNPTFINNNYSGSLSATSGSFSAGPGFGQRYNNIVFSPSGQNGEYSQPVNQLQSDVTQSWEETYNSPLGQATKNRSDQQEYYKGNFSGSILVVTQSLNPECGVFLKANDKAFNYTPYVFSSTFGNSIELFNTTQPLSGQMFLLYSGETYENNFQGVQYIKLNKTDQEGINRSIFVENLNQIVIQFADGNNYIFDIDSVAEKANYYTYTLASNNNVGVLDQTDFRQNTELLTGSITYNLAFNYTQSVTNTDATISLTGSNFRTYAVGDPSVTDPVQGKFLADAADYASTLVIEMHDKNVGGGVNSSASFNSIGAGWTASFNDGTNVVNLGIQAVGTGGTDFHRWDTAFINKTGAGVNWDTVTHSITFTTSSTTVTYYDSFQPSGIIGENFTAKVYNFSSQNNEFGTSKYGQKTLYFNYENYIETGSATASIDNSLLNFWGKNLTVKPSKTRVGSFNYPADIATSASSPNDPPLFNFNWKVNITGSMKYNTDVSGSYRFAIGIANENVPLFQSSAITTTASESAGTSVLEFNENIVFTYGNTDTTINSWGPRENLTLFITDLNGVAVGNSSTGAPSNESSSLDQLFKNIIVSITASNAAGASVVSQSFATSSTIVEPYLSTPFYNTDCDITQGNVSSYILNKRYMDIDYPGLGPVMSINDNNLPWIAQNYNSIINDTATRATVSEYNYVLKSSLRSKYEGSKTISPGINKRTSETIKNNSSLFFESNLFNITGNKITAKEINQITAGDDNINVKLTKNIAILFNNINSLAPLHKGGSTIEVDKIITPITISPQQTAENNNTISFTNKGKQQTNVLNISNYPSKDGVSYSQYDLANSFESEKDIIIEIINNKDSIVSPLILRKNKGTAIVQKPINETTILRGGSKLIPILSNEIYNFGTKQSTFQNTLNFITSSNGLYNPDYEFLARNISNTSTWNSTASLTVNWDQVAKQSTPSGMFNLSTNTFTLSGSTKSPINLESGLTITNNNTGSISILVKIIKNGTSDVAFELVEIPALTSEKIDISTGFGIYNSGDTFIVQLSPQRTNGQDLEIGGGGSGGDYFKITQLDNPINSISLSSAFTTGSSTNKWLTSSAAVASVYGKIQTTISGSNFPEITEPFTVNIGDEIRFNGIETETRMITKIIEPFLLDRGGFSNSRLYIELDQLPPSASNATNFLIRRYVDDNKSVLIESLFYSGSLSKGIAKPKYITNDLQNLLSTNEVSDFFN